MLRYEVLKDKPNRLLSLTGFTPEEFEAPLPLFSKRFSAFVETKTLDGKARLNTPSLASKGFASSKISCATPSKGSQI